MRGDLRRESPQEPVLYQHPSMDGNSNHQHWSCQIPRRFQDGKNPESWYCNLLEIYKEQFCHGRNGLKPYKPHALHEGCQTRV